MSQILATTNVRVRNHGMKLPELRQSSIRPLRDIWYANGGFAFFRGRQRPTQLVTCKHNHARLAGYQDKGKQCTSGHMVHVLNHSPDLHLYRSLPGSILPAAPLAPVSPFAPLPSGQWIMNDSGVVGVTAGTSGPHFGGYLRPAIPQSALLPSPAMPACHMVRHSLPAGARTLASSGAKTFYVQADYLRVSRWLSHLPTTLM